MIHPCLTLSDIRYVSRVKWSNQGKGVAIEKGALWSPSTTVANLTYLFLIKCFKHVHILSSFLEDILIRTQQVITLQIKVDLGVMITKWYSILAGDSELEFQHFGCLNTQENPLVVWRLFLLLVYQSQLRHKLAVLVWILSMGEIVSLVCPRGVMVKAMDCEIVISEFELQSRYYLHFRTNTFGKGMNPLNLPSVG